MLVFQLQEFITFERNMMLLSELASSLPQTECLNPSDILDNNGTDYNGNGTDYDDDSTEHRRIKREVWYFGCWKKKITQFQIIFKFLSNCHL